MMMNYLLLLIPFISALVGWLLFKIAIKLFFHRFLPQRKKLIAERIAKVAGAEFFSFDEIEQKIADPENIHKIIPAIAQHVDDFLRVKLPKQMPMIGMFVGEKTIVEMKRVFMAELQDLFPVIMQNYTSNLRQQFDLEKIIFQKISSIRSDKIDAFVHQNLSKELRLLTLLGALLGFIIGLVQVLITIIA